MLYPSKLNDDEYIRIVMKHKSGEPTLTECVKTFEEYKGTINKYKHNFNLYTTLATVKMINGETKGQIANMERRKVLYMDFDDKDYPDIKTVEELTSMVKSKLDLYIHCIVDSGNGYHLYYSIKSTSNISKVVELNKRMVTICGADLKAVLPTQIARIPTSLNLKNPDDIKPVSIVNIAYGNEKFHYHKFNTLESVMGHIETNRKIEENNLIDIPRRVYEANNNKQYQCVEKMIYEGADKGERNFCLGRIIKTLQKQSYTEERIIQIILEFNERCRPPKPKEEILADYKSYCRKPYNLLGCAEAFSEGRQKDILEKYCDIDHCRCVKNGSFKMNLSDNRCVDINNDLLEDRKMQYLSGYDYLILTILEQNRQLDGEKGMSIAKLKSRLTGRRERTPCISDETLKKCIKRLKDKKIVTYVEKGNSYKEKYIRLREIAISNKGYTKYYYSSALMLINGIITQTEYLVYIHLIKELQLGQSVSYDDMAKALKMDSSNIGKCINGLHMAQMIYIQKKPNEKGYDSNYYQITDSHQFDDMQDMLNSNITLLA